MVHQTYPMDLMSTLLICGSWFTTFRVVDDFNRESIAVEAGLNLPDPRVMRGLERLGYQRAY